MTLTPSAVWQQLCPTAPSWPALIEPWPLLHACSNDVVNTGADSLQRLAPASESMDCLRLDRLDHQVSGNKSLKLLGHIDAWQKSSHTRLLSFGGRWSNHLHALAYAAARLDIPAIGVVQGYPEQPLTPTLMDCQAQGMQLILVDKMTYRQRYQLAYRQALSTEHDAWVIPEGGDGPEGEVGFHPLRALMRNYDEVWVAAGSGLSAQALARHLTADQRLVVVNAVADNGVLAARMQTLTDSADTGCAIRVIDDAHFGGFGYCPAALKALIQDYDQRSLPLDPVYTVKLAWALERAAQQDKLRGRVLVVHTGGLQGRRSL